MESLGPYPVLIVDTGSESADFAERAMSRWGLRVSVAGSGKEAIELTKTHMFDVILIGLNLNDINAYETASIIRKLGDQFQNIPIIGYGAAPPASNGNGDVFSDFLSYPINETELFDKLKNHLDKTRPEVVIANLDRCTDGDVEFRRELAQLLANNVVELMTNIEKALQVNDPEIFIRAVHKTKTTLSILNDTELLEQIGIIQTKLKESCTENLDHHVKKMINRCQKTIAVLNIVSSGE